MVGLATIMAPVVSHLANVLQWAYNEAQGLLEVESSAILGLVGSNRILYYPVLLNGCVIFKWLRPAPSFLSQKVQSYLRFSGKILDKDFASLSKPRVKWLKAENESKLISLNQGDKIMSIERRSGNTLKSSQSYVLIDFLKDALYFWESKCGLRIQSF